jgi:hypothetical protein
LYATAAKRTTHFVLEAQRKFPKYWHKELAESKKVYNQ